MSVVVDPEKKIDAAAYWIWASLFIAFRFDCQITVIGILKDSGLYHS